jgi:hypothetical protein
MIVNVHAGTLIKPGAFVSEEPFFQSVALIVKNRFEEAASPEFFRLMHP